MGEDWNSIAVLAVAVVSTLGLGKWAFDSVTLFKIHRDLGRLGEAMKGLAARVAVLEGRTV